MPYTEDEDFYDPDAPPPDLSTSPNAIQLCMECAQDEDRYEVVSAPIEYRVPTPFQCDNCGKDVTLGDAFCDAIPLSV